MKTGLAIWRYFLDGVPEYLARHYWWAYLWKPAIWFFDHQPIINSILFGQYQGLMAQTLIDLQDRPPGRFLQLTNVYGKLTPTLVKLQNDEPLFLIDACEEQLRASQRKLNPDDEKRLLTARMHAEQLGFIDNSFSTVLIFFLMHELPRQARQDALAEVLRIMSPGSRLVVTEYGYIPRQHWIYRFVPLRWQLLYWEPFLDDFWQEDLDEELGQAAKPLGKAISLHHEKSIFDGFYRVLVYEIN